MTSEKSKKASHRHPSGGKALAFSVLIFLCIALGAGLYYFRKVPFKKISISDTFTVKTWEATLYFGDERSDYMTGEYRKLASTRMPEEMAKALINEIIAGPSAMGVRTIPKETRLLSVKLESGGLLKVNFSAEVAKFHPGGSTAELMTIYSIVNTLTKNIPEVRRVQFLIEGKEIETIAGHIDCSGPIAPRPELIH